MKRKSVCVDMDGVLAKYDKWRGLDHFGEPIPGAVEFTRELIKFADVIIFTCRCKGDRDDVGVESLVAKVKSYLDRHGFAYTEIYSGQGKPFAAAYIDDRAVVCDPQSWIGPETSYRVTLLSAQALCREAPPCT